MKLRLGGYARVVVDGVKTTDGVSLTDQIGKVTVIENMKDSQTGETWKNYQLDFGGELGRTGWFEMRNVPMIEAIPKPGKATK